MKDASEKVQEMRQICPKAKRSGIKMKNAKSACSEADSPENEA